MSRSTGRSMLVTTDRNNPGRFDGDGGGAIEAIAEKTALVSNEETRLARSVSRRWDQVAERERPSWLNENSRRRLSDPNLGRYTLLFSPYTSCTMLTLLLVLE